MVLKGGTIMRPTTMPREVRRLPLMVEQLDAATDDVEVLRAQLETLATMLGLWGFLEVAERETRAQLRDGTYC